MFLNNKYSQWYNNIVLRAKNRKIYTYTEKHHIIPKCMGGDNHNNNLVELTAKEHFVCHLLLVKMVQPEYKQKLTHALWAMSTLKKSCQYRYKINANTYKIVREKYSKYVSLNNPMKTNEQRNRMKASNNNPLTRQCMIDGISFPSEADASRYFKTSLYLLRKNYNVTYTSTKTEVRTRNIIYKDTYITPMGVFKTKKEIQRIAKIPEWTLNTIYKNLNAYPIINGRSSKNMQHLKIDPLKTWKQNGFDLLISDD